jgi:hypothetical protein
LDGFVQVSSLEQNVSTNLFARLRERTVGDGRLSVPDAESGGRVYRLERMSGEQMSAFARRVVEVEGLADEGLRLLLGEALSHLLIVENQTEVFHRISPQGAWPCLTDSRSNKQELDKEAADLWNYSPGGAIFLNELGRPSFSPAGALPRGRSLLFKAAKKVWKNRFKVSAMQARYQGRDSRPHAGAYTVTVRAAVVNRMKIGVC